jgi:D-3-phosphoglycerate dehydrogenase
MTDVVVTDQAFGGVERERSVAEKRGASFADYQIRDEAATVRVTAGAKVVFVNFAPITAQVLDGLAPGAVVIRYGIGYDNVDVSAASDRGIRVCNVPDYGADTVADHTVALLLAGLRRVAGYSARIRAEGWAEPSDVGPIKGFADTTVGLVGTGRIGRSVAARLRPFGFRILAADPFVKSEDLEGTGIELVTLEELLEGSDAVSLHAPLTPENHHLLDARALSRTRPGVVIVNTSRGPLVDETALVAALDAGTVAAAGLDVHEVEPLPQDSRLRSFPDVMLTPHAAFYSEASLANLQRLAAEEADRALAGEPLRCAVNA